MIAAGKFNSTDGSSGHTLGASRVVTARMAAVPVTQSVTVPQASVSVCSAGLAASLRPGAGPAHLQGPAAPAVPPVGRAAAAGTHTAV